MLPIVLYSEQDTSRDFKNLVPDGNQLLDWYSSDLSNYFGPPPSVFPCVCISMRASGADDPLQVGFIYPTEWSEVETATTAEENSELLSSICNWGDYQAGAANSGPRLDLFKASVFQDGTISLLARLELAQKFPLLDSYISTPGLPAQYWMGLKYAGYAWMTPNTITKVEAYATMYKIPLI